LWIDHLGAEGEIRCVRSVREQLQQAGVHRVRVLERADAHRARIKAQPALRHDVDRPAEDTVRVGLRRGRGSAPALATATTTATGGRSRERQQRGPPPRPNASSAHVPPIAGAPARRRPAGLAQARELLTHLKYLPEYEPS